MSVNETFRKFYDCASLNAEALATNRYPGRGIVCGVTESGKYLAQVYWIMGRSPNSRNRVFKSDANFGRVYTEPADFSKVKDTQLTIYNAMIESGNHDIFVVSNGAQTDAIIPRLHSDGLKSLDSALYGWTYEPDSPIFTPRITAACRVGIDGNCFIEMSILRKSVWSNFCDRITYAYSNTLPGFGRCVTTYLQDGNPPPHFCGEPILLPIGGGNDTESIANFFWPLLDEENRISLAVKRISLLTGASDTAIINKYGQV